MAFQCVPCVGAKQYAHSRDGRYPSMRHSLSQKARGFRGGLGLTGGWSSWSHGAKYLWPEAVGQVSRSIVGNVIAQQKERQ